MRVIEKLQYDYNEFLDKYNQKITKIEGSVSRDIYEKVSIENDTLNRIVNDLRSQIV